MIDICRLVNSCLPLSFSVLTANAAAYELTGLKKAQFTSTYFIFDIIHKDDAINFVRVCTHYPFTHPYSVPIPTSFHPL